MVTQNPAPIKLVFTGKITTKSIKEKTKEMVPTLEDNDIIVKLSEVEQETAYYMSTETFMKYATLDTSNATDEEPKAEDTKAETVKAGK